MFTDHEYWIGAHDPNDDNIFDWINGGGQVDPHAIFWQIEQPNINDHDQCLIMKVEEHHWNDMDCHDHFRFVCERDL